MFERATQTVFGAGPAQARLLLVGEQPGDAEDLGGAPFIGPAGGVLAQALKRAGLDDVATYTTNAVKHFRWKPMRGGGQRRLHERPSAAQTTACRPWLAAEITAVAPAVIVALGAMAAGSLFGPAFRLTAARGTALDWPPAKGDFADDGTKVDAAFATWHPSAVLRARAEDRDEMFDGLVADLRLVRDHL